ncbi:MAG: hypothetical protein Q4E16_05060 [Neisseria sp.]|nr:hypothetical protein [Neisseria sp.]
MHKLYFIEYNYEKQTSHKAFHFVHANDEGTALVMAKDYIETLLSIRFGNKEFFFEIIDIQELPKKGEE